jgi:hypothetical protein
VGPPYVCEAIHFLVLLIFVNTQEALLHVSGGISESRSPRSGSWLSAL